MMLKQRSKFWAVLLAALLAVVMITITAVSAGAAGNTLTDEEIRAIVETTTDASKVTSPMIEVANQVRSSVVGVNNYTNASSYYG